SANPAFCGMVCANRDDLVGRPAADAIPGDGGAAVLEMFDQALAGSEPAPRDSELLNPSARSLPVAVSAALLRDYNNEVVGCVCLFQDITRRKQVEALYEQLRAL